MNNLLVGRNCLGNSRLELPNMAGAIGLAAAVDYLERLAGCHWSPWNRNWSHTSFQNCRQLKEWPFMVRKDLTNVQVSLPLTRRSSSSWPCDCSGLWRRSVRVGHYCDYNPCFSIWMFQQRARAQVLYLQYQGRCDKASRCLGGQSPRSFSMALSKLE